VLVWASLSWPKIGKGSDDWHSPGARFLSAHTGHDEIGIPVTPNRKPRSRQFGIGGHTSSEYAVQTDGKLGLLARLTPDDCRLIDGLMTKYSYDLHEQAAETPRALPLPDDIEADLLALAAWREEFDARPKAF
jgi:hypothetical protein